MRLVFVSFILLTTVGFACAWRDPPPPAPGPALPVPTPQPRNAPSGADLPTPAPPPYSLTYKTGLKCYTGGKVEDGPESRKDRIKEVKCDGLCNVVVADGDTAKFWNLTCDRNEKNEDTTPECFVLPPVMAACKCDIDLCFTPEIADEMTEKLKEASKKWKETGETTFKGLFNIRRYGGRGTSLGNRDTGSDSASPNTGAAPQDIPAGGANPAAYPVYSHGTDASSTISILLSIAALLLAT